MNKNKRNAISFIIVIAIAIIGVIIFPTVRIPVAVISGIIFAMATLFAMLKLGSQKGDIDYNVLPDWLIIVWSISTIILVVLFLMNQHQ